MDDLELLEKIQALRVKRKAFLKMVDDQIESYTVMLEALMKKEGKDKLPGKTATAFFSKQTGITVTDWSVVLDYVRVHDAYDILQKRISTGALLVRLDAGEFIPGVVVDKGVKVLNIRSKEEPESES